MTAYIPIIMMFIIIIVIQNNNNRFYYNLIKGKKEKRMLPKNLLAEFTGKVCSITQFNSSVINGKITAVEENWIKVETKKESKLLNGDMIKDITVLPDKYQY